MKISGDGENGVISTELTNPFVIEVRDQNSNPFGGAAVRFIVTAGGGSLSDTTINTNIDGRAESTLTLGSNPGTNTVWVSLVGTQETVTFSAEALASLDNTNDETNDGNNGQNADDTNTNTNTEPLFQLEISLASGWNLIYLPLQITQVNGETVNLETIGDLFQLLMPTYMYIYYDNSWTQVFADSNRAFEINQSTAIYLDAPMTLTLVGFAVPPDLALQRGMNLIGIPRQSNDLQKVSDLLTLFPDVYAILVAIDGKLYLVGRAGDSGDVQMTGGQACIIISANSYMTSFNGAPQGTELSQ